MIFTPEEPQRLMIEHLHRSPQAFCIVGMGIGKTASTLAYINQRFQNLDCKGVLIVAPIRVCNLTWPLEVRQWDQFRWMRVANLRTPHGRHAFLTGSAHIYLINYEALTSRTITVKKRRSPTHAELEHIRTTGELPFGCMMSPNRKKRGPITDYEKAELRKGRLFPWLQFYDEVQKNCPGFVEEYLEGRKDVPVDTIVFDESTKLKAPDNKGGNRLRRWLQANADKVPNRIALTGTPAPNSLLDLFAQVRLLDDGKRLGPNFEMFKRTYFHTTGYMQYNWAPNANAKEAIEQRIADITITLRSSDWLKDVPDTVVEDVEIKMPDAMLRQYRDFEKELVLQLGTKDITAANAAALVTKLLQFTSGAVYDEDRKTHDIHDLKIAALRKLKKDVKTPLLVACIYQHEQERIRRAFPDARFFSDAKSETQQLALLEQWNQRKIPMLVAHPASVGHGLNLQRGSSTMVWMSLTYSRELYEQMIARLARRGQHDVVTVYRLMCPGTADDAVATVLQEKRDTEQRLLSALMLLEAVRDDAKLSEKMAKVVDNTANTPHTEIL
jgi:hypothetical protein